MAKDRTDEFRQYVDGKTVAVVGPAVASYDQSAEVEAHDIVYRISYRHDINKPIPNYGTRTDVVFYNAEASRKYTLGVYDSFIDSIDWVLLKKHRPVKGPGRDTSRDKTLIVVPPFGKANQLPIALGHLVTFNPAQITVFGADLYLGGQETAYHKNYLDRMPERNWWGVNHHEPKAQHRYMRNLVASNRRLIVGDDRFLAALKLPTTVYLQKLRESWNVGA
jgi:hypothetical protein